MHAYPTLGRRQLGAIRRSDIQAWVKDRADDLSPGSVELVYRWVATIFKAAVTDRLIAASPCQRIALLKRDRREVVPLAVDALERLVTAMPERYRALVIVAAGTGLGQGECFGLTVDRIDFCRQLRVDRQLLAATGGVPEFGPPAGAEPSSIGGGWILVLRDATATAGVAAQGVVVVVGGSGESA